MLSKSAVLISLIATFSFGGASVAESLTAGTVIGNVPWEFEDENGNYVGFDIDLAKLVAERLGRDLVIENIPFNGLFSAVQSGRIDFVPSTITITDERMESVTFAQPYYDSDQSLTAVVDGPKSLEDMRGKTVGVDTGATGDIWATEHADEYGFSEISRYEGLQLGMNALVAGRISGYISDIPALLYYVKDKPNLQVVQRIATGEQYGWMFAKNSELAGQVDGVLTALKEEGVLADLHEKWFGVAPDATSSTVEVRPMPAID